MADLPIVPLAPGWHAVLTAAALAGAVLALAVAFVALRRERKLTERYTALMAGADGTDLAAALDVLTGRVSRCERRLDTLEGHSEALDARVRGAIQRVGILRYSAYQDAGGDQSFALALLDDGADGVVMSSLVSRSGARVFAKPVARGRSTYALTTEEERVIAEALDGPEVG